MRAPEIRGRGTIASLLVRCWESGHCCPTFLNLSPVSPLEPDRSPCEKRKPHGENGYHQNPLPVSLDPAISSVLCARAILRTFGVPYQVLFAALDEAAELPVPVLVEVGALVEVMVTTVVAVGVAVVAVRGSTP